MSQLWDERYQHERLARMQYRMDGQREMHVRDIARLAFDTGDSRIRVPVRANRRIYGFVSENYTIPPPQDNTYGTLEVMAIQPLFYDDNGLIIIEHMIRHAYDEVVAR